MKRKILVTLCLILVILSNMLIISNAESKINIQLSKSELSIGEEVSLNIGSGNILTAAGTIWIYFDNEKLECLSKMNNINVIGNRIIYTWISEDGHNEEVGNLLNLEFKTKKTGVTSFTIVGEIYDEDGNKTDINQTTREIEISEKTKNNIKADTSKSSNLKTMRLNKEGIVPDFNPNITDYYIIVDENTDNIKVTANPESNNAKVQISGNANLKNGLNKIIITVNNEGKSKKYNINVTKTDQKDKANSNLETLAVEKYDLIPEYRDNITEYNIQISNTEEKLNILAIPEDMKATVEIKNNENLMYGNNIIKIIVTAQNQITQKVYTINAYKRNKQEQEEYEEKSIQTINENKKVVEKINKEKESFLNENEKEIKKENEQEKLEDKLITWGGIIVSIIIIILLIISIKRDKFNK